MSQYSRRYYRAKPSVNIWAIIGLSLGVVVVLGGAFWAVTIRGSSFTPQVSRMAFERELLQPPPLAPNIFSNENIRRLYKGNGMEVAFIIKHLGRQYSRIEFKIETWKYGSPDNPTGVRGMGERRTYVKRKMAEFSEMLAKFRAHQPMIWKIEFYLDDTEGVNEATRAKVLEIWKGLQIPELIALGDGFNIQFCRITATDYLNGKRVQVPQNSPDSREKYIREVEQGLDWLLEDRKPTKQSSIATGLFNQMNENAGRDSVRYIYIFSDGLENHASTASVYRDPGLLLDEGRWQELDRAITVYESFPDLKGAFVDWHFPPPPPGRESLSNLIRASREYWRSRMANKCSAEVRVHY